MRERQSNEFYISESIIIDVIAPVIASIDLTALTSLSLTNRLFYRACIDVVNTKKLLNYIMEDEVEAAREKVSSQPLLMFKSLEVTYPDGQKEVISPLKLAVNLLNSEACKMFENCVQDSPALREKFVFQMKQQKTYYKHEEIQTIYAEYEGKFKLWRAGLISKEDLVLAWRKVGEKQAELQENVLKEFCKPGRTWREDSDFNKEKSQPEEAYDVVVYEHERKIKLNFRDKSNRKGLGSEFTLFRQNNLNASAKNQPILSILARERQTFNRFFEKEKNSINQSIDRLKDLSNDLKKISTC